MRNRTRSAWLGLACLVASPLPALAQKGVPPTTITIGGHALVSDHDLADNLAQSPDHLTLLGLLRLAGMTDALHGHGPFTLFAPSDAAFAALPAGELDMLRNPDNRARLMALLSAQLVAGNFSDARLRYLLRIGKGATELETITDGKLRVFTNGSHNLQITNASGTVANVTLYDVKAANGVMFVTDRVLPPG